MSTNHKYGSNIPEARKILEALLSDIKNCKPSMSLANQSALDIEKALGLMVRRQPVRMTPKVHSRGLSEWQKNRISRYAEFTNLSQQEIAERVKTNPGRVSEFLNGSI